MYRIVIALVLVAACGSKKEEARPSESASVCVDGTQLDCETNGKGKWTGAKCCLATPMTCVDGTQLDCETNGKGKWTGAKCCIAGTVTCADGKQPDCETNGKGKWTGA